MLPGLSVTLESIIEWILLEKTSPYMKEKEKTHEFMYGKSCLTSLIAFSDKMTGFIVNKTVEYVIYLDFSKAFDTVLL